MRSEYDNTFEYVSEPLLQFGHGQRLPNPKDGLFLFGPLVDERKPKQMRVGVIGTANGIARFRKWTQKIAGYIPPLDSNSAQHIAFPGFEAAFNTEWLAPVLEIPISETDVRNTIRLSDRHKAIYETVTLYEHPIRRIHKEDDAEIALWFVVIPDEVWALGRPLSKVPVAERVKVDVAMNARLATRLRREPSLFPEDMEAARMYQYEVNFHHQLKARLLDIQAVVQVVRESSFGIDDIEAPQVYRRMQDPATVAWNLCTTAFFKAGGRPWKIANVRAGVCYVGLVFKRNTISPESGNACCGAQMFLDSGDGLVFKGAMGPWYSIEKKEFHLPTNRAKELIETVVKSYVSLFGKPPAELFIHGKTRFDRAEWEGFRAGAPPETKVVCVRITRSQEMKLFRLGQMPVLRGSAFRISDNRALLWTTGYIPELRTYPGREVPNPLSIELSRGDADLRVVLSDIMGLTKVNFNTCIFSDGLPVTLRFADAVGEILTAAPSSNDLPPLPFRHYI